MMKKCFIMLTATVLMLMLAVGVSAETIAEGVCGDDITWLLDDVGILTISGEGEMLKIPAQNYKDQITQVVIEEGVTNIVASAFRSTPNLISVTIAGSVKTVDELAFYLCGNIKELYINEGVEYIGRMAFSNCESIKTLIIPDTVTYVGEYAFQSCGFTSVSIGTGLKELAEGMFAGCRMLQSIEIPYGITKLNSEVFSGCTKLENVILSDTITYIGEHAFNRCKFEVITIPESVDTIEEGAFFQCDKLIDINIADGNPHFVFLNGALLNNTERTLLLYCRANVKTSYIVPDGIETIASYAVDCWNLKEITIPASVQSIKSDGDSGILSRVKERIIVDKDNMYYSSEDGILFNKDKTVLLRCPQSNMPVSNDGEYTVPSTVKIIAENAFWASKIERIVVSEGLEEICNNAFSDAAIKNITLPDSTRKIGEYAFSFCRNLEAFNIPEGLTVIESGMFCGCFKLKEIFISAYVEKIIDHQFIDYCYELQRFVVSENNNFFTTDENGVLYNKDKTILVRYPIGNSMEVYTVLNSVITLEPSAFSETQNLKKIILHKGIQTIHEDAFGDINADDTTIENVIILGKEKIEIIAGSERFPPFYGLLRFPPIYGYADSWIAQHVNEYNEMYGTQIPFFEIGNSGDINGDALIDENDLQILICYYAGWNDFLKQIICPDAADVNGDGQLSRADVMILSRYLAGWSSYETLPLT